MRTRKILKKKIKIKINKNKNKKPEIPVPEATPEFLFLPELTEIRLCDTRKMYASHYQFPKMKVVGLHQVSHITKGRSGKNAGPPLKSRRAFS
jgi:hypothetical protein